MRTNKCRARRELLHVNKGTPLKIRFGLLDVMRRFGVRKRGAISQLSGTLGITRQTASKIVNGRTASVSFEQLAHICDWLLAQVPEGEQKRDLRRILPGALLRFSGPWDALCQVEQLVLHLGERYFARIGDRSTDRDPWISGADSSVATKIVRGLTSDGARFQHLTWKNVPLHIITDQRAAVAQAQSDKQAAMDGLLPLKSEKNTGSLLIGSQRVNLLTEAFVADLFGCTPFETPKVKAAVPVFLRYRESNEKSLPDSCFGSAGPPPGAATSKPGCYWRTSARAKWQLVPYVENKSDAGIVIVAEDLKNSSVQVALFGYSADATKSLGEIFCLEPHRFWPLRLGRGTRRFEVFVCAAKLSDDKTAWTITPVSGGAGIDKRRGAPE